MSNDTITIIMELRTNLMCCVIRNYSIRKPQRFKLLYRWMLLILRIMITYECDRTLMHERGIVGREIQMEIFPTASSIKLYMT